MLYASGGSVGYEATVVRFRRGRESSIVLFDLIESNLS